MIIIKIESIIFNTRHMTKINLTNNEFSITLKRTCMPIEPHA